MKSWVCLGIAMWGAPPSPAGIIAALAMGVGLRALWKFVDTERERIDWTERAELALRRQPELMHVVGRPGR